MCSYQLVSFLRIAHIRLGEMPQSSEMIVGVVAHLMPFFDDLPEQLGVFPHIVAHHEKGGMGIKLTQSPEDKGCGLGDRTIIEGQVDGMFMPVHPPPCLGKHPTQPE